MEIFSQYHHLWEKNSHEQLEKFLAMNPNISQFESQLKFYENLIVTINDAAKVLVVVPLAIYTGFLNIHIVFFVVLVDTFVV